MERRLKERLIGAAVLVLLAVIFIPMLLNDNTQYNSEITGTNIPARPPDEFNTRIVPLDQGQSQQQHQDAPPVSADTGVKASPPPVSAEKNSKTQPPENAAAPPQTAAPASADVKGKPQTATASAPETPAAPQAKAMGVQAWMVQLGSFSSKKNAEELNAKLRGKGYAAFVEPLKQKSGMVYRVRVGPELLRSDAEQLRGKIKKTMHMDGLVISYP